MLVLVAIVCLNICFGIQQVIQTASYAVGFGLHAVLSAVCAGLQRSAGQISCAVGVLGSLTSASAAGTLQQDL